MMISNLNCLEVIFKETNIVGGSVRALAGARARSQGPNYAYTITATRTEADSLVGKSFSRSASYALSS